MHWLFKSHSLSSWDEHFTGWQSHNDETTEGHREAKINIWNRLSVCTQLIIFIKKLD